MAPFPRTRYHLQEWGSGRKVPRNPEEYFNMKHSSARNVVERTFGLWKKRWGILRSSSFYPVDTHNNIILACCLVHNFIRNTTPNDLLEDEDSSDDEADASDEENESEAPEVQSSHAYVDEIVLDDTAWNRVRDVLAALMYNRWKSAHANRGLA